ncbi:hypothetical protein HPB50_000447 [Hyalomma asiaticum]|uniref:Uncharacterized protein n=1 Tax=Hyalomma asiaticum TaxID=266040 RepID=A0ACB7TCM9_HYAAI|nr:hypothetical protein HPB50_000447 [Hyalomma asiaticum]
MPDSKRQDNEDSEGESTVTGGHSVANLTTLDVDEGGFRIVRQRKGTSSGIPVLIVPATEGIDFRQVNPHIVLCSEVEAILGGAPVRATLEHMERCYKRDRSTS